MHLSEMYWIDYVSLGSWRRFKFPYVPSEGQQLMCAGMHELVRVFVSQGEEQQCV